MAEPYPLILSQSLFAMVILSTASIWYILHKAVTKTIVKRQTLISASILLILFSWLAIASLLGSAGFFSTETFLVAHVIIPITLSVLITYFLFRKQVFKQFVNNISLPLIISVQFFRVMGASFLYLYALKLLPGAFAIPSGVGDIIIGLSAPLVGYLYYVKKDAVRNVVILWNVLGILDLVIAFLAGFLTYP